jgi:hypothetical protein
VLLKIKAAVKDVRARFMAFLLLVGLGEFSCFQTLDAPVTGSVYSRTEGGGNIFRRKNIR